MKLIKQLDLFLEQAVLYFDVLVYMKIYVSVTIFPSNLLFVFPTSPSFQINSLCLAIWPEGSEWNVYKTVPIELVKNIMDSVSLV